MILTVPLSTTSGSNEVSPRVGSVGFQTLPLPSTDLKKDCLRGRLFQGLLLGTDVSDSGTSTGTLTRYDGPSR